MILISAQDSPDSGSWDVVSSIRRRPGYRVWLREPVVLNIAILQGVVVCATVEVIRTGTFLYFVDELRLVRHTNIPLSQVVNLDGRMFG